MHLTAELRAPACLALLAACFVLGSPRVEAQVPVVSDTALQLDTLELEVDPDDVSGLARVAQRRFEARRIRLLPLSYESFGGRCDEVVGRICTTYDEGEWYPQPDSDEIVALRGGLLAELDELQSLAPTDAWILGQRVWYRAEGGDWAGALATARGCRSERWWCLAVEGFALHGLGRWTEAETLFEATLAAMDPERADRWRVPRWAADGGVRDVFEAVQDDPEALAAALDRFWALADPLWIVNGNDRRTAHFARWTATELREGARNPFRLSWGNDLTQLTVRHGWQIGWERTPARDFTTLDHVVGHNHPLGRDYGPGGDAFREPWAAGPDAFRPVVRYARSLYAPPYAPVLLPMEGQVALFPRVDAVRVVATHFLPDDTTYHADHRHPLPWLDPGDQAGMPDRIGLHALLVEHGPDGGGPDPSPARRAPDSPTGSPELRGVERRGRAEGASLLELPPGRWVVSAESWSPERRRAGRLRFGLEAIAATPDVARLSDLLLLRPADAEPTTLEGALDLALPTVRVRPGQPLAIGFEIAGLGFRAETLVFELSVERTGRGVLGRIGDFLGISSPPRPLALSWEEPSPTRPESAFRYLALDVPDLEDGEYEIRLVLRTAGRSDAVATRRFEVERGT